MELSLNLGGIKCVLSDTAGVRTSSADIIEKEGIKRAKMVAQQADIVVAMVEIGDVDHGVNILKTVLMESTKQKSEDEDSPEATSEASSTGILDAENLLLVLNKVDLKAEQSSSDEASATIVDSPTTKTFEVSCQTKEGIDSFLCALTETAMARVNGDMKDNISGKTEGSLITRARHRQHVQAAVQALHQFDTLSQQGTMVVDMAAEELRLAASELGRVTGAVDVEDILDVLFKDFCIGK